VAIPGKIMAYGEHWEWRSFGAVEPDLRRRLLALQPAAPDPWQVEDVYLHAPGCAANVKLRGGELKLKRFLARDGDLERWLEDPAEVWPLPLTTEVAALAAAALGVAAPGLPGQVLDQETLLEWLGRAAPPVQSIAVRKTRHLRFLSLPGVAPDVLLELADIAAPQAIASLALEHPAAEPVHRAGALLGLHAATLTPMNYMQALDLWASGRLISA
jgi:hypothetical protein